MAIRTLEYTVTEHGILPAVRRLGGVEGEHNATELIFNINAALKAKIETEAQGYKAYYRFDGYSGSGNKSSTVPKELTGNQVSYKLEKWITSEGGNIEVYLVVTVVDDSDTEVKTIAEIINFPALIRLKGKPDGEDIDGENEESLTALVKTACNAANNAEEIAQSIRDDADDGKFNGEKGDKGDKGDTGATGAQGPKGNDGIGIFSVEQTTTSTADGGENIITITDTDGITSTFSVRNGSKGNKGERGDKGDTGAQGIQGVQGPQGDAGADGQDGADGRGIQSIEYTGLDYVSTSAENKEITETGKIYRITYTDGSTFEYNVPNGTKGEKGDQGIQGEKGDRGEQGAKGDKGDQGIQGVQGVQGLKGDKGADGVGIFNVDSIPSTEDSGENIITVKDTEGREYPFIVRNGSKGSKGDKGDQGIQGVQGETGAQGEKGEKGDTGDQGIQGIQGISAYNIAVNNGFKGTEEQWLASLAQGAPEYAQNISECTDQNKMYVLPDGSIYAYITKTETIVPTNQIPISTDSSGAVYNGKGYKNEHYILVTTGVETANSTYECSGFIPYKATDIARIKNYRWTSPASNYDNITFYDKNFNRLGFLSAASSGNKLPECVKSDGTIEMCLMDDNGEKIVTTAMTVSQVESIAYMRLSFYLIDSTTVVTVNEPLEEQTITTTEWNSTGLSYTPADYENEILNLQNRVGNLESNETGDMVDIYVAEEAERVAKNVYSHQNGNTFTFLAITDAHYLGSNNNIVKSIIHAGQGMDLVRKYANVDFAANLGDNGWGSGVEGSESRATIEMGIDEIRAANACIDRAFRGIPNLRVPGNHCSLIYNYTFNNNDYLSTSELFPMYGAYNHGAIFQRGERERGYCYYDFEDWKLRVICVNTSDIQDLTPADDAKPIYISGIQGKWFAETLDMSSKSDAAEWSILIFSHAPLDWGTGCIYTCDILKAYMEGTSGSVVRDDVTISYNYAGKNAATIIGNCHGHNHNFQVDKLRRYIGNNTTEEIEVLRFGMPNACFERTNEKGENDTTEVWDIEYGEAASYEKIANTANDTSFCVVTVDPITRKIYADCYGAGYDRVISY